MSGLNDEFSLDELLNDEPKLDQLLSTAPPVTQNTLTLLSNDFDMPPSELFGQAIEDVMDTDRFTYDEQERTIGTPQFWKAIEGRADELASYGNYLV